MPLWLAPSQINIIPVNNEYHLKYAEEILKELRKKGFRVSLDNRDEKLSYKMRESQIKKIPYTLILGDKEKEEKIVSFRKYASKETENLSLKEFIEKLNNQIKEKK